MSSNLQIHGGKVSVMHGWYGLSALGFMIDFSGKVRLPSVVVWIPIKSHDFSIAEFLQFFPKVSDSFNKQMEGKSNKKLIIFWAKTFQGFKVIVWFHLQKKKEVTFLVFLDLLRACCWLRTIESTSCQRQLRSYAMPTNAFWPKLQLFFVRFRWKEEITSFPNYPVFGVAQIVTDLWDLWSWPLPGWWCYVFQLEAMIPVEMASSQLRRRMFWCEETHPAFLWSKWARLILVFGWGWFIFKLFNFRLSFFFGRYLDHQQRCWCIFWLKYTIFFYSIMTVAKTVKLNETYFDFTLMPGIAPVTKELYQMYLGNASMHWTTHGVADNV